MHERECKGYISFNRGVNELNRGVNELNRGVNELNRGVNDLNRGVNHSVARQGCNLLRAAVTSAVTSQGCCCGNLQIHPLDLGQESTCAINSIVLLTSPELLLNRQFAIKMSFTFCLITLTVPAQSEVLLLKKQFQSTVTRVF